MLKLQGISKSYSTTAMETLALSSVDLHVKKGEFLSVMGPSGCGKSTLLNIMGLIDRPNEGNLHLDGQDTRNWKDSRLARFRNRKIGFIFQSFHLIPDLSIEDNVELPLLYRRTPSRERSRLAKEALEQVGLSARRRHLPHQLSGGQRQRAAIARAIIGKPELLLADEPTGNLDSAMGKEILELLFELNRNQNSTIVMVTHDEQLASQTGRILRLFDGRIVN